MTASENIAFGLEMRGIPRAERGERVARALDNVQLGEFATRYPKELSGGQRQRVALARALVIEPPILLLDEPLSNLDAKLREEMQLELRVLQQKVGVTTVLVTHDQSEALSMSDRVVVMEHGRAVQIDTPLTIYEKPRDAFVSGFVGKTNLFEGLAAESGKVQLREHLVSAPGHGFSPGTRLTLSLRPEKIVLGAVGQGITARVGTVAFHGSHWLYTLSSSLGELIAVIPNSGEPPHTPGEEVSISWPDSALRALPEAV
jgi:putative spermidine/putrescine transport system ATP-binding protein